MATADYEKLGLFYLGKRFDLANGTRLNELVLYESKDLVTHAVCVGMTGSGKTGLGITVLEEAALDGIPVIAIDPKGDLSNIALTFPDLRASDFAPWVDPGDAQRQNITPEQLAAQTATRWKDGLTDWDEDGDRIARLRAAADVKVYTPGSRAAAPLAVLGSFQQLTATDDEEDTQARVATTAAALLSLAGVSDADGHGREQALITAILSSRTPGATMDMPWLVQQVQRPSFDRIGVIDLETFYPARDRQELALRFNSVLAAPGFDVWSAGDPLDIGALLFTPAAKPRVAIISLAHLDDTKRMLVVSLVLNALLQWTRRQGGTGSLRALLYMDEVFGYLPPVANPPSKLPLLTLLKQARAFGVGVMLSTQNPVDLDYKALSNTGTWFLGKLQTERDKARVLDGLEGIGGGLDRQALDRSLSGLRSRVFLMHNVHDTAPVTFETRWTLSYLRGPMGRDELRRLFAQPEPAAGQPTAPRSHAPVATRPVLPAGIAEYFLHRGGDTSEYTPVLYGSARVRYVDTRRGIDTTRDVSVTTPFEDGAMPVDWNAAADARDTPDALTTSPARTDASFRALPAPALDPRRYSEWRRDFEQWIVGSQPLKLFSAPALKLTSRPGEAERDFRIRIQQAVRETRDAAVEKLRARYAPKVARVTEKVRRAEETIGREKQQVDQQKVQTALSIGATMLGALMGRKAVSLSTLGRATTAARGVGRSVKESQDVARAEQRLQEARDELQALEAELQSEIAAVAADASDTPLDVVEIKPKRGGVDVQLVTLAWAPVESG